MMYHLLQVTPNQAQTVVRMKSGNLFGNRIVYTQLRQIEEYNLMVVQLEGGETSKKIENNINTTVP